MDLLKQLFKRIICKHDYEFRSRYYRSKNNIMRMYEDYQCLNCGKRKEQEI